MVNVNQTCLSCSGAGRIPDMVDGVCPSCRGRGQVITSVITYDDGREEKSYGNCKKCSGRGRLSVLDQSGDGDFMVFNDGTIRDLRTGLCWHATPSSAIDYRDAQRYCDSSDVGGFDDWRLPTIDELRALYVSLWGSYPFEVFNWPSGGRYYNSFWSSTSAGYDGYRTIDFEYGQMENSDSSYYCYVRPVRREIIEEPGQ